jgi:hypothetical protein
MNAILYLLPHRLPCRYLPRNAFSPRSTVYNIFHKFQRQEAWGRSGPNCTCFARADGARGLSLGCGSRQPIGEIGGKEGGKDDALGHDAGTKVKGRMIHALVDTDVLPMRVVVHWAAIWDRGGAALVRPCFSGLN